jgi:adenylate kinase
MAKVKVKLLYIEDTGYSASSRDARILQGTSDWVEIEQESLETLHKHKTKLRHAFAKKFKGYGSVVPIIVTEPEEPSQDLADMVAFLDKEIAKDAKAKVVADAKKVAAKQKRDDAKIKKKAADQQVVERRELIMLEQLKKKYGN